MASYYKYKSREGEDQIDWRKITQGITDDLTKVATDREGKREAIDQAVLTNLETIADKPQGQDTAQNQLIASYADQASSIALANQKLLKSGSITLKEYTARTNTGGSSTKKLFGLSKKYQENYQVHMDRLKSVDGKPPVGSLLEGAFIQYAEAFSNPDNTRYYMDPATGEAFLAKVSKEGDKGKVQKIDGEAYSLMNVGTAENIITRNVNRYQSAAVAEGLASEAGILKEVVMEGDVKTRTDAFKRMFVTDANGDIIESELSDVGRSTINQIKATFASDMDYASMLTDPMGKTAIAENADGTYTNIITNQKYEGKPGDAVIFETINGQQQPKQSDNWEKQKKQAEREVLNQVKSKLGIEETAMDDKEIARERLKLDWAKLNQDKKEFNKEEVDEASDLNTKIEVISTLYGGNREDINSALTYYKDYGGKSSIQKVDRSDSGISITYEDEFGDIVTSDISFYVPDETSKTMMPNPNYDPNKKEDAVNNPKQIKGRIKTEAQFIQSASQLLIGESVAKGLDSRLPDGSLKYNRPFTSTPGMSVENIITKSEAVDDNSDTFSIANSKYLGNILGDVNLMDEDSEVASKIPGLLKDLGIEADAVGSGASDEVLITIPGYNKSFKLETDFGLNAFLGIPATNRGNKANVTRGSQTKERKRFRLYLEQFLNTRPDLSRKLNFESDPKKGKFSKYNNN